MSDLENLQELKRLLENRPEEEPEDVKREKRFIHDVSEYLLKGVKYETTGIQAYDPQKMIDFLGGKSVEIQRELGGEWAEMEMNEFETLAYTTRQKVLKSAMAFDWKS